MQVYILIFEHHIMQYNSICMKTVQTRIIRVWTVFGMIAVDMKYGAHVIADDFQSNCVCIYSEHWKYVICDRRWLSMQLCILLVQKLNNFMSCIQIHTRLQWKSSVIILQGTWKQFKVELFEFEQFLGPENLFKYEWFEFELFLGPENLFKYEWFEFELFPYIGCLFVLICFSSILGSSNLALSLTSSSEKGGNTVGPSSSTVTQRDL